VLGGKVFSTVFSFRQGIAPAGSFVCVSFVPPGVNLGRGLRRLVLCMCFICPPGVAGSKYLEIAVQKISFSRFAVG
jgi:hypothetical protein